MTPRADEWSRLKTTIQELQNAAAEAHSEQIDLQTPAPSASAIANAATTAI